MKITLPNTSGFQIEINKNKRAVFLTGAGVSVGSGLPTYYGGNGAYDSLSKQPADILSKYNKENNPGVIWDEISSIIEQGLESKPCVSHKVIARLQELTNDSYVVTQNVDGLHKDAGSKNLIELHGKGREVFCTSCSKHDVKTTRNTKDFLDGRKDGCAPICPDCGQNTIVPNVIMFEEMLADLDLFRLQDSLLSKFDYVFVVGTQMQFDYIHLFVSEVKYDNPSCQVIDVNPDEFYQNLHADFSIKMNSDAFFKEIEKQLE